MQLDISSGQTANKSKHPSFGIRTHYQIRPYTAFGSLETTSCLS